MRRALIATLEKDLGRVLAAGHPWVYRAAIRRLDAQPGAVVTVKDRQSRFVGRGIADAGPIAVRLWTTKDEAIDEGFVRRRVREALAMRRRVTPPNTDSLRLIHGEGDRLGGVVCDRYGPYLVLALDGEGALAWREPVIAALRSELPEAKGLLVRWGRRGDKQSEVAFGEVPEAPFEVQEYGMRSLVDLHRGQKTGLFLDHRESRRRTRAIAEGARCLNLYGYTGGFSVAAALGGARSVDTVDVAEGALALAERGFELNDLDPSIHRTHAEDVPAFLDHARASKRTFDLIVADPPSFSPNEAARSKALSAYRRLHRSCLKLLTPGGLYLAASCSSHVHREAFELTLRDGAEKANRIVTVLDRWGAPPDHPRPLAFPEGDYLTALLCRVD